MVWNLEFRCAVHHGIEYPRLQYGTAEATRKTRNSVQ